MSCEHFLPRPTTDLDIARSNLDAFGCCLIANAMTPDEVRAACVRLEEQIAAKKQL